MMLKTIYLMELRRRLISVIFLFGLILLVSFYFSSPLFNYLIYPLQHQLPQGRSLIAVHLTSAVCTPLSIAFHTACLLTLPYLLWQIWKFVHPALYGPEKSLIKIPLFFSLILLLLGMAFAYWIILPFMFHFFIGYLPSQVKLMPDMAYSVNFITKIMALFGIFFQIPLVCLLLVSTNIIPYQTLKRSRPYVIVGAFTVGMLFTPPDVVSQLLLALPLWMLYEFGLFICSWRKLFSSNKELNSA